MSTKKTEQLKILIVDDLKTLRDGFTAMFREFYPEAHIDEASDVMQAMPMIQKETPPYDAVFTDINMPEVSGLKLISLVRDLPLYKETPLIVISSLSDKNDVDRAIELGANGYLIRPLQKDDFEIVRLAYLEDIRKKKRKKSSEDPEQLVKSLRKMLK